MPLLTRTNKTNDKQVQPPPAPAPQNDYDRLAAELAQVNETIETSKQVLMNVDELSGLLTRKQAIEMQIGAARHLAWQSKVNEWIRSAAAAKTELSQLNQKIDDNSRQDEAAKIELWGPYSWDARVDPTEAWIEKRISLMAQVERCKARHVQLASRISELVAVINDCDKNLEAFRRAGTAALDMNPFQLYPTLTGAGPDGSWFNGVFTPAPQPAPTPPPQPRVSKPRSVADWSDDGDPHSE